ncbi:glycosyltransferase [Candidatus Pelagibacter sp.]|nr:glycosyltransferase [Candidatus Pelagibacter sp.]
MNYSQITVGIVTFKSENVIFDCLKSIKKIKNIIILDNSNDKILKKKINKKYPKIKILLSKKNLGYGAANNSIIKKSKTPFVFILSPDVMLQKNCEENLLKNINKLKQNFAIISPIPNIKNYFFFKNKKLTKKKIFEVNYVHGFAMMVNKLKIKNIGMFDEKIFLYTEEDDLCKRLILANQKIYIIKNAKVLHLGAKSSNIGFEFDKCRNWHWGWSKVYFEKKYANNFFVYLKFIFKLFIQMLKIIFYIILLNKKEAINKTMRFLGTLNSLLGRDSWYRPKFNFD